MIIPTDRHRLKHKRTDRSAAGYTLIEMLAAMTAATLILASLATTVVVSTSLLEIPADDAQAWRDRDIADRIANDMRYSKSIDDTLIDGFLVTKTNVTSGLNETATYATQLNGLTRQIDTGLVVQLDENSASHSFIAESFNAGIAPNTTPVRVRAVSSASESSPVSSITVPYPSGLQDGDMLVLGVSAESPNSVSVSPAGWNSLFSVGFFGLRMITVYRFYDSSTAGPAVVNFLDGNAVGAATMVAIENAAAGDSSNWANARGGFASRFFPTSSPSPLEPTSNTEPFHLNLQVIVSDGNPWPDDTLGMPSYVDAVHTTCGFNSVGMVFRNGATPALSSTPRCWHQSSGLWLQTGIRLGNGG